MFFIFSRLDVKGHYFLTRMIFIDLQKSFDTITNKYLLQKLKSIKFFIKSLSYFHPRISFYSDTAFICMFHADCMLNVHSLCTIIKTLHILLKGFNKDS